MLIVEVIDVATVTERLGHGTLILTSNTYVHAITSKDKEAIDKLEKKILQYNFS